MRKEKGIEEEAEEIIKEGEAIEKAIQQDRQNPASEDDEIEEMIDNGDEYALEPAGAKKAAAFSSIPDISRIEEIAEELRVNDIYFTSNFLSLIIIGGKRPNTTHLVMFTCRIKYFCTL